MSKDKGGFAITTIPDQAREIYPMMMFATITTGAPRELADWYANLGFWELFAMPGPDGDPVMIHLRRLKYQDILIVAGEQQGSGRPALTLSFSALDDDLDAIAKTVLNAGAGSAEGPVTRPWNTVELVCTDSLGNVVILTQPIDTGAQFDDVIASMQ